MNRARQLYSRGPIVRTVARAMMTLALVMAEEIAWDVRYNPQWTRFWD